MTLTSLCLLLFLLALTEAKADCPVQEEITRRMKDMPMPDSSSPPSVTFDSTDLSSIGNLDGSYLGEWSPKGVGVRMVVTEKDTRSSRRREWVVEAQVCSKIRAVVSFDPRDKKMSSRIEGRVPEKAPGGQGEVEAEIANLLRSITWMSSDKKGDLGSQLGIRINLFDRESACLG